MSRLRLTGALWGVTILVHLADHVRRGLDASPEVVIGLGTVAFVLQAVAIGAALRGAARAPLLAVAVAAPNALGVVAVHLLPRWSLLSDSFPSHAPGVTAFSWATAVAEVAAGAAFAWAGWAATRRGPAPVTGSRASA